MQQPRQAAPAFFPGFHLLPTLYMMGGAQSFSVTLLACP